MNVCVFGKRGGNVSNQLTRTEGTKPFEVVDHHQLDRQRRSTMRRFSSS